MALFPVTKIQHFCTKDGPGIRTTVFFKGCPLRCTWCHNPETATNTPPFFFVNGLCLKCGACEAVCPAGAHSVTARGHLINRNICSGCLKCVSVCPTGALERCARFLRVSDIFDECMKDVAFYGNGGGVTLSGGEPTVHANEIISLLSTLKETGVHTAIETCGYFPTNILPRLSGVTDLFLWDVKDTNEARHIANTGTPLSVITDNLLAADALGAKTVMRCIILRTVNLNEAHLRNLIKLYGALKHCDGIELIPYHAMGAGKCTQLGRPEPEHREWIPLPGEISEAESFLKRNASVITH